MPAASEAAGAVFSLTSPTLRECSLVNVRLLLFGFFVLFVNTTLLVPVLPAVVAQTGGSSVAGLVTGAFYFAAVATQLRMPQVLRRYGARRLLVTAFLLLGLPCFVYVPRSERPRGSARRDGAAGSRLVSGIATVTS